MAKESGEWLAYGLIRTAKLEKREVIFVECRSDISYRAHCSCGWSYEGDDYRQVVAHDVQSHRNSCIVTHDFPPTSD